MLPGPSEIARALAGTIRITRGDMGAVAWFDRTVAGFSRSFFAAVLVLPADLFRDHVGGGTGLFALFQENVVGFALLYAVLWLFYPAVVAHIARFIDRDDRTLDYLVPYNWAAVPIGYAMAVPALLVALGILPPTVAGLLGLMILAGVVYVLWQFARRLLDVSPLQAAGLVVFDLFSSMTLWTLLGGVAGIE